MIGAGSGNDEGNLVTARKKWPRIADDARLDSIALCLAQLRELVEAKDHTGDPAALRALAGAIDAFHQIHFLLCSVGGPLEKGENNHE